MPWASFTPYRVIPGHRVPTWRGSFPPWKPVPRGWELPKLPLLIGWGAGTGAEPCHLFLAFLGMACSWEAEGGTSLPPALHLGFYLPQTATPSEVGKDEKSPPKSGSVPKPLGLDSRPFSRPGNCRAAIGQEGLRGAGEELSCLPLAGPITGETTQGYLIAGRGSHQPCRPPG